MDSLLANLAHNLEVHRDCVVGLHTSQSTQGKTNTITAQPTEDSIRPEALSSGNLNIFVEPSVNTNPPSFYSQGNVVRTSDTSQGCSRVVEVTSSLDPLAKPFTHNADMSNKPRAAPIKQIIKPSRVGEGMC